MSYNYNYENEPVDFTPWIKKAKGRKWLYTFLGLLISYVPAFIFYRWGDLLHLGNILTYVSIALIVIGSIFFGMTCYCINNIRELQGKRAGGLHWLIAFISGFVVIPIIVVQILRRSERASYHVLGWTNLL